MAILTGYSQKKKEEGADNTIICDGGANKARNNINKGGDNLKVILDKVNSRLIAVEQSSGKTTSVNISGDYITRTQLASSISSAIANYYTKEQIDNMELGVEIAYVQVDLTTSTEVEHLLYGEDSDDTQKLVVAVNHDSYYHYSHTDTDNDIDYFYFYNGKGEGYVLSSEDDSWTAITDNSFKSVTTDGTTGAGILSLVAGSNITLTPNGNSVTISASGGGSGTTVTELFFASLLTAQQDVDVALTAGKLPILKAGNPTKYYTYSYTGGTNDSPIHYFYAGDCSYYTINRDDEWTLYSAADNEDLFRCDTVSTTSSQVSTALINNKLPILVVSNKAYVFSHVTNDGSYNTYYFIAGDGASYTLCSNAWAHNPQTNVRYWSITSGGTTNTFYPEDQTIHFKAGTNVTIIGEVEAGTGKKYITINSANAEERDVYPEVNYQGSKYLPNDYVCITINSNELSAKRISSGNVNTAMHMCGFPWDFLDGLQTGKYLGATIGTTHNYSSSYTSAVYTIPKGVYVISGIMETAFDQSTNVKIINLRNTIWDWVNDGTSFADISVLVWDSGDINIMARENLI